MNEDLARQIRFMEEENEREVEALQQDQRGTLERFVAGYEVYGHSWRTKDLAKEAREERLDERNYRMMEKMRSQQV